MLKHYRVYTMVAGRIAPKNDIRGNVLLNTTPALHKRVTANAHILLYDNATTHNGIIINFTLTGYTDTNAYDNAIPYFNIMADMHLIHKEIAISNSCSAIGISRAGNNDILANTIVITNYDMGRLPLLIMEVLRRGAYYRVLVNNVTGTHLRTIENAGMGHNNTVITDFDVRLNVGKRFNLYILP